MKSIFFSFVLLVILISPFYSQELSELRISGKCVILPEELIDRNNRDVNGEVCAGLMMISDLDGLAYDSYNQIVKIKKMPGQDLLFLSPGERVVTVYKTGFKPLKIILHEYGIKLMSGTVWKVEITGDRKLDLIPVNILASQPDVRIFVDEKDKGTGKTFQISAGEHRVRLEKEGYKTVQATILVSASSNLFNYKMEEIELIQAQIKSVPSGAKILLGDLDKGETDKGLFIMPGKYKLKLIKSGYRDLEDSIEVSETGKNIIEYRLIKNEGALSIHVVPADAKVLINKEDYSGKTEIPLSPGKYKLEIEKHGYNSAGEIFEIKLGTTLERNYRLVQKTGGLQFSVQPLEARVNMTQNGEVKQSWQGIKVLKDLPAGVYKLECSLDGYKTVYEDVIIEEGKTITKEVPLERRQTGSADADSKKYSSAGVTVNKIVSKNDLVKSMKLVKNGARYSVSFDLAGEEDESYNIELLLMDESNKSYSVKLKKITGSAGEGKFAGTNRNIIWESGEEFPGGADNGRLYLNLKAEKVSGGIAWYYYAGAAIAGGVAAVLLNKPAENVPAGSVKITASPSRPAGN
ncbi:MAG: PEGA domain-containing protein [Ignavibacteria bacterium]